MSFYSAQVGKNSSRYCNSNLYGSNLSSVYADGPPPLDDSTQDESEDEMVFKSTSREKATRVQEDVDKELKKPADVQNWSSFDSKKNESTTADDEFGDFTGFADFSSAFGSTKESKFGSTSWFGNGDSGTSTGTSKKTNQDENEDLTNCDDDFGCFSGGDESDFGGFKGFSDNGNQETKSDNIFNGVKLSENGVKSNDIKKSDFFSDDDDEFDDFQSTRSNAIESNKQPTMLNDQHMHSGLQSSKMPSIFSDDDDNDDDNDDDEFGEFGTANTGTTENIIIQKESEFDSNSSNTADKEMNSSPISDNESEKSSINTNKIDSKVSVNENKTIPSHQSLRKDGEAEHKSAKMRPNEEHAVVDSLNQLSKDGNDVSNDNEFGNFSGNVDNNIEDNICNNSVKTETIKSMSNNTSQSSTQNSDNTHDSIATSNLSTNDDDFGDFSAPSHSNIPEKTDDQDNESTVTNMLQNNTDFRNFSAVSHSSTNDDDNGSNSENLSTKPQEQSNDDNDFGDFGSFSAQNEHKKVDKTERIESEITKSIKELPCVETELSNSAGKLISNPNYEQNSNENINQNSGKVDFGSFNSTTETPEDNDDDFGDFASIPESTSPSKDCNEDLCQSESISQENSAKTCNDIDKTNDFGNFTSTGVEKSDSLGNSESGNSNDEFGDFASLSSTQPTVDKQSSENTSFGNFATFPQSSGDDNGNYDDFGDFAAVTEQSNKEEHSDDFGDFAQLPTEQSSKENHTSKHDNNGTLSSFSNSEHPKPGEGQGESDFGEFGKPLSIKPTEEEDDDFGDFSGGLQSTGSSTQNNHEFTTFKSSSENSFAGFSSVTKDSNFEDFSSVNQMATPQPTSTEQRKETGLKKSAGKFCPKKNHSMSAITDIVKQGFVNLQPDVQRNTIIVILENELQSGKPSVWNTIKGAERDGSLRFEWIASDHKLKMLESLSMLPVRIQTSASFKSSGPVQTPLFASGLGLLEPMKGVITPFHHVEELDPSQDPFGAPPEVGVPDLGFGGNANAVKKQEYKQESGTLDVKESMDSISVSSSLDLDFLAPSGSTGDLTKTEGKALYEDDLLGLGMQFSPPNSSPKVINGTKDPKTIFKFNNTTLSLPSDNKNLSQQAKKIVDNLEDLSFMLSKVLMFPLKSKE